MHVNVNDKTKDWKTKYATGIDLVVRIGLWFYGNWAIQIFSCMLFSFFGSWFLCNRKSKVLKKKATCGSGMTCTYKSPDPLVYSCLFFSVPQLQPEHTWQHANPNHSGPNRQIRDKSCYTKVLSCIKRLHAMLYSWFNINAFWYNPTTRIVQLSAFLLPAGRAVLYRACTEW